MNKKTFYVTTPLYYVNARPHLGTLYSTLLADTAARWHRLLGEEVFFLTGTDEHGQKLAMKAEEHGLKPQVFVDQMVPAFKKVWEAYGISYDYFIRTTDHSHKYTVTAWIKALMEKGEIYKDTYEGLYCVPCETFIALERQDAEKDHLCPSCLRPTKLIQEENYFFKLSAYQERLLAFYKAHPDFIQPRERINEIISFVSSGLKDLSISRMSVSWGIPFPEDPEHTVYVWGDALMNYVSALGFMREDAQRMNQFWPANLQVMAKDIVKFHAVYFPAFLMAVGIEPAHKLLVHGYLLMNEDKMSKSKGNAYDPTQLAEIFGVDPIRYYLVRHMVPTRDGNFDIQEMAQRIGSDLANGLGNLLQRTAVLAHKYDAYNIEPLTSKKETSLQLHEECRRMVSSFEEAMNRDEFHIAYGYAWRYIAQVNAYFHEQEPWKEAQSDRESFIETLFVTVQSLYVLAHIIAPLMPGKAQQLSAALGHTLPLQWCNVQGVTWNIPATLFIPKEPLFVRPEIKKNGESVMQSLIEEKEQKVEPIAHEEAKDEPTSLLTGIADSALISIEDVLKVHLVVGQIVQAVSVPKSEKLLSLQVDLGAYGMRHIFAGIASYFACESLIGKKAVFVANLKPRKMMGSSSEGMVLCAKDGEGNFSLTFVDESIVPGTRLS